MSAPQRRPWQSGPSDPDEQRLIAAAPLYKAAYEEAKSGVEGQTGELDAIRQRAGAYMSFVGAATAFLVGTSLSLQTARGAGFYVLAGVATALSLVTIAFACLVLLPTRTWEQKLSGQDLVEGWIETDVPPTETLYFRALALLYDEMRAANEAVLQQMRWRLAGVVVGGSLQVLSWALLAWYMG